MSDSGHPSDGEIEKETQRIKKLAEYTEAKARLAKAEQELAATRARAKFLGHTISR